MLNKLSDSLTDESSSSAGGMNGSLSDVPSSSAGGSLKDPWPAGGLLQDSLSKLPSTAKGLEREEKETVAGS